MAKATGGGRKARSGERDGVGPAAGGAEVALIGGSAAARQQAEASRPRRYGKREVAKLVATLGRGVVAKSHLGAPHVTLSAQVPWVEGRGYLNLINPQSFFADGPNVGFIAPYDDNVEGKIEVWLLGLEAGGTYFLEIRVGSYPLDPGEPGQWEVRSSEGPAAFLQATGPGQSLPVILHEVSGPMALVTLTSTGLGGWVFYDVEVAELS
jgi:hypothetical protein